MKTSIQILRILVISIGIAAAVLLAWFPLLEGRAANLDLWSIYTDPLILYSYAASVSFFAGLFQIYRLLGLWDKGELHTAKAARTIQRIKYCAMAAFGLVIGAGIFVVASVGKEEDPAGFIALCLIGLSICTLIGIVAARFEKSVRKSLHA